MRSLLTRLERRPIAQLQPHPQNPRRGNVAEIASSLDENWQFAPVVVQSSTGYVLAGSHTLKAAVQNGWTEIDTVPVVVDDAQAIKIMLAANRIADLGTYDLDKLSELLSGLDDLAGTGYTDADLAALLPGDETVEDDTDDPDDDPVRNSYGVVVMCRSEVEQLELLERFLTEGLPARAL